MKRRFVFILSLAGTYLLVLFIPVFLHWDGFSFFVTNFHGEQFEILELFGFSASFGLFGLAFLEAWYVKPKTWQEWLPIGLTAFIGLLWLSILIETSTSPDDYLCYENAARMLQRRANPYHGCYYYPPLLAQGLAWLENTISSIVVHLLKLPSAVEAIWSLVFYFFQSTQLLLILVSFRLCLILANDLEIERMLTMAAVAGLFILNIPLLRTVVLHQVNLWILVSTLAVLVLAFRNPFWAGIAAAVGGHIKVYPLTLTLPFILKKNLRALAGISVGLIALTLIPISLGFKWLTWQHYFRLMQQFPQYNAPRNNSFYSIVANLLLLTGADVTSENSWWRLLPRLGYFLLILLMLLWLVLRFYQRWRIIRTLPKNGSPAILLERYGLFMDLVAAQLLLSPSIWEHQWVIIIPFILWSLCFQQNLALRPRFIQVALAAAMIFALPSFDIIPFSYLRMAGLIILLWCTSPKYISRDPARFSPSVLGQSPPASILESS